MYIYHIHLNKLYSLYAYSSRLQAIAKQQSRPSEYVCYTTDTIFTFNIQYILSYSIVFLITHMNSPSYNKNNTNSFNIFRNKKDLAIVILSFLLLLSVTGLYFIREIGEWLGRIIHKIYHFFYSLFATLFFSTGQILNASSNAVADAAILTIDISNDAVNDIGDLLKGGSQQPSEHHKKEHRREDKENHEDKHEDKHEDNHENMTNSSYLILPTPISTRYPSTTKKTQSLASVLQHGTPAPVQNEPSYMKI